jgi:hypothetical protein
MASWHRRCPATGPPRCSGGHGKPRILVCGADFISSNWRFRLKLYVRYVPLSPGGSELRGGTRGKSACSRGTVSHDGSGTSRAVPSCVPGHPRISRSARWCRGTGAAVARPQRGRTRPPQTGRSPQPPPTSPPTARCALPSPLIPACPSPAGPGWQNRQTGRGRGSRGAGRRRYRPSCPSARRMRPGRPCRPGMPSGRCRRVARGPRDHPATPGRPNPPVGRSRDRPLSRSQPSPARPETSPARPESRNPPVSPSRPGSPAHLGSRNRRASPRRPLP